MISKLSENKVLTSTAEVTLDEDHVFHVEIFPDIYLDKPDIQEHLAAMKLLAKKPFGNLMLVNVSEIKGLTLEGKQFSKGKEMNQFAIAVAGVVGNPISRVLGNFFTMFSPPEFEHELFTNPVHAKRWLLIIKKDGRRKKKPGLHIYT